MRDHMGHEGHMRDHLGYVGACEGPCRACEGP